MPPGVIPDLAALRAEVIHLLRTDPEVRRAVRAALAEDTRAVAEVLRAELDRRVKEVPHATTQDATVAGESPLGLRPAGADGGRRPGPASLAAAARPAGFTRGLVRGWDALNDSEEASRRRGQQRGGAARRARGRLS